MLLALAVDVALIAVGVTVVWLLDRSGESGPKVFAVLAEADLALLVVSVTTACAAMVAIMTGVIDRLSNDRRAVWISTSFMLYGVVGIPAATLSGSFGRDGVVVDAVRFAAHLGGAVLMGVATWGPPRPNLRLVTISAAGLTWVGLGAVAALLLPELTHTVIDSHAARYTVGIVSVITGLAMMLVGLRERSSQLTRLGLACSGLAAAHIYRVLQDQPGLSLAFATARLLAVVMALWAVSQLTQQTLRSIQDSQDQRRDELMRARTGLARAVLRDQELRIRLTRLTRVADLLGQSPCPETDGLRSAVKSELARLELMLLQAQDGVPPPAVTVYQVAPMVQDLVTLRRCSGMDIRYDIAGEPWADGSANVLKQVVTNLLANCARHAPGSPVRVQVGERGDRVRLRVSDFGPGIPPGQEDAVFERGVHDAAGGGQGLGLHICRELLAADGGKIEIRRPSSLRAGCTVIVEVPKARRMAGRAAAVARAV
jgi:two-component system OmpR family sensor kinase